LIVEEQPGFGREDGSLKVLFATMGDITFDVDGLSMHNPAFSFSRASKQRIRGPPESGEETSPFLRSCLPRIFATSRLPG